MESLRIATSTFRNSLLIPNIDESRVMGCVKSPVILSRKKWRVTRFDKQNENEGNRSDRNYPWTEAFQ